MPTAVRNPIIRTFRPGDEGEANRLFNLVFRENRPLEEWHWKFQWEPIITVAEVDGKIVGEYPNLVTRFRYCNRVMRAAQPVDTAIQPDFRGGELLRRMFAIQLSLAKERQIAFGFGFPNPGHHRVGKRFLKYCDLFPLPVLFRRLNYRQAVKRRIPRAPGWILALVDLLSGILARLSLGRRGSEDIAIKKVSKFDERIDALWKIASESYGILMVRDRQFLNWRYVANPSHRYTILIGEKDGAIVGYTVLTMRQDGDIRTGEIADILTIKDRVAEEAIVRGALQWFLSRKTDFVICHALREDRTSRTLGKYGFREHPAFPSLHLVYQRFSPEIDEGFLKNPRNWHLTHGDSIDTV